MNIAHVIFPLIITRFDHTYNTDFWGTNVNTGVKGVSGIAGLPAWKNASTGVVQMYQSSGWGGWTYQVNYPFHYSDNPLSVTLMTLT